MKQTGLIRVGWVLLAFLGISAALLTLGQRDTSANPTTNSYGPSGTHALLDLLRSEGYRVDVSTADNPRLAPDDLAIAFYVPQEGVFTQELDTPAIDRALEAHLKAGGRVLSLAMDNDFVRASKAALGSPEVATSRTDGTKKRVSAFSGSTEEAPVNVPTDAFTAWQFSGSGQFVRVARYEKGLLMTVTDGLPATNRFIDREDNADFVLGLIRSMAIKGGRIVFTEASFGNSSGTSILAAIGPWAEGAWMQLLLLFAVIVLSLGYRFGLAEETRSRERGQRELLDAVADTYLRGRMTTVALSAAYEDVDGRLRKALKLPKAAPDSDRDARLPHELVDALHQVHEESLVGASSRKAAEMARRLYALSGEFLAARAATDPLVSARSEI